VFGFKPVNKDAMEYLGDGSIIVEMWAVQMPIQRDARDRRNTAAMLTSDALSKSMVSASNK
jgi:hypothetical protein